MTDYTSMTLQQVVEDKYSNGWDDFVVQMVNAVTDLEELDIESWNNAGEVPHSYHEHVSVILGVELQEIDYEQLTAAQPNVITKSAKRKKKTAKKSAAKKSPTTSDSDPIWDGVEDTVDIEAEEDVDGDVEEDKGMGDAQSEGFEDSGLIEDPWDDEDSDEDEEEEIQEDDGDEDEFMIYDIDEIEVDEFEDEEEELDIVDIPEYSEEPEVVEPAEEVVDMPIEEEGDVVVQSNGELSTVTSDTATIMRSVQYTEIIVNAEMPLKMLIGRLINIPYDDIKTISTGDMVIKLLDSNIAEIRSTAAKILDAKAKASVLLGLWLGEADEEEFAIAASIAEAALSSDDNKKAVPASTNKRSVAQALDTIPDVAVEILTDFVKTDC